MEKVKPNVELKEFWSNNDRFADLFNTVFFCGEKVLRPENLQEKNTDLSSTILSKDVQEGLERYRDVVKCAEDMEFVILGIENQDKIHYAMPLRCRIYDDLQYLKQVQDIVYKNRKENNWKGHSGDEFLSGMKKEDRIKACFTIVIYYGEDEWDGPRSLKDMVELPEVLEAYFQDYRMHLLCVRDEDGSRFSQEDVRELFYVLHSFYHDKEEELKKETMSISNETYRAIIAVQKNEALMEFIKKEEEEDIGMCRAVERIWESGRIEGVEEGRRDTLKECIANLLELLSKEQISQALKVPLELVDDIANRCLAEKA